MARTLSSVLLLAALAASSCVGPNNAFNGIASWNTRVTDSKWGNELIYVGLWVIPVYEITFTLDALVFNAFDFWGGENPIGPPGEFAKQGDK